MPKTDLSNAEARRIALAAQGFDRLVARVDLKAERKKRRLHVLASYAESGVDQSRVADALAGELRTMARWLELDGIDVARRGTFASALRSAVEGPSRRRAKGLT
ncbi:MAG: hypothetical protein IIC89_05315 [Chloroflexi bacterium]|nr:hypothetical protein [Chloroflexota bacterium]